LPPPSSLKPDIPEAIERVVLKALAKHPEDRYATVAEFLSAWKQALDDAKSEMRHAPATVVAHPAPTPQPVSPPPPSYGTPATNMQPYSTSTTTQPKSRNWMGWTAGCLVVLCVLAAIGGGAYYLLNSGSADRVSTETPELIQTEAPATEAPTDTPEPTETVIPAVGNTLFEDNFSTEDNWGTGTDSDSSVEYVNGGLRMQVYTGNYIVWSTADTDSFENIHIEVTVKNHNTDPFAAFAIICDGQGSTDSFYYLGITPDGHYAIADKPDNSDSIYLTENDQWETTDKFALNAASYRLGADCGNGKLTLYVDGQVVDSVSDSTYTSGYVGLLTWSDEQVNIVDVTYDDFIVTELIH